MSEDPEDPEKAAVGAFWDVRWAVALGLWYLALVSGVLLGYSLRYMEQNIEFGSRLVHGTPHAGRP